MSSRHFAVTAMGADQPGIVAAIAGALRELGGNIEDSAMTRLAGQFSVLLVVSAFTTEDDLSAALHDAVDPFDMSLTVNQVQPGAAAPPPTHTLTVHGPDQPGILSAVAKALAEVDVNVTNLETQLVSGPSAIWAMVMDLTLPESTSAEEVDARLASLDAELALDHSLRAIDMAVL